MNDEPLSAPALRQTLAGLRLGNPLHVYGVTGSTNDDARRLAEGGAPEGALVVAETQTAGRGRSGRRWITPPGTGLAFSLVLRPPLAAENSAWLMMLAGVAVCAAVEQAAGVAARLKWPNDVLAGDDKAGGILLETALAGARLDYALLGIGLNVSAAPPREAVNFPATSLAAAAGRPVARGPLLRAVLEQFEAGYQHLLAAGASPLLGAWRGRLAWLGQRVVAHTPDGAIEGTAERAEPDGALILRLDSGEARRVVAGDLSLRQAGSRALSSEADADLGG